MPIMKVGMVSDGWVQDADKVDGFHARLTPAPNVIMPLDASGVLDLSTTYIKSNVYTFRRVDLTNATSDYMLQIGEEAYISFNNATSVPLHIATTQDGLYSIDIILSAYNVSIICDLLPNNTTYTGQFYEVQTYSSYTAYSGDNYYAFAQRNSSKNDFLLANFALAKLFASTLTTNKVIFGIGYAYGSSSYPYLTMHIISVWANTTTAWTSLGTLVFGAATSGRLLIKRLL